MLLGPLVAYIVGLHPLLVCGEGLEEEDLRAALRRELNLEEARNVILFVGDGMGPNTVTATRILRAGEESYLVWEKFPSLGSIKTYSSDKQVPDSACTANAMFTGVKNNYEMLGLDAEVKAFDCSNSLKTEHHLKTLATLAQEEGKATGVVTNTRITDATPAAMYAHSPHRTWECDSALPENATACKDIARQLVEDLPGKYLNVILGGGNQVLRSEVTSSADNPIDTDCCRRADGRDLIQHWADEKASKGLKYATVNNTKSLKNVNTMKTDYLFGIFSNSHMPYEYQRNTTEDGSPSLELMVVTAINLLAKYPTGFFLMVEGGLIDKGHHDGKARVALEEVLAFNDAVNSSMILLEKLGLIDETLVIVTSDHSHTLSISGYPEKGSNILGIADKSLEDGMPYTTLSYATAGKQSFHFVADGDKVLRLDPSSLDTTSYDYHFIAPVVTDINTHGGNDVFVYAAGPYSHLFHNVHENTYISTVIQFAARLGKYASPSARFSSSSQLVFSATELYFLLLVIYFLGYNR